MNLDIPESFEIFINGSKASKFIDFPNNGFSSKLGSFEIHAR